MDEVGRRYQALALRIGRHLPDYIDFWLGDPLLREVIAAEEPAPPIELHVEAVSLHEAAAGLPADDTTDTQRRDWLMAQLSAMSAITRWLGGEEIAFIDLVEVLFDVPVTETPADDVRRAHALLDEVLPRGGSLRDRLTTHDELTRVAPEHLPATVAFMAERLRERTAQDLGLPDDESIEVVALRDRPWGASALYLGDLRTRVELNLDLPAALAAVTYLAAHETYPGHHAERARKEVALWRERGLGEAAVACIYTPEIAISEGLADLAREVVATDSELEVWLRELVTELGLEIPAEALEREVAVERARSLLRNLTADAALALCQQGLPEPRVRAMLAEQALRTDARIEHDMRSLREPLGAAHVVSYTASRLIASWLEVQGQTAGFARLLREQLSPGQLRAELGEP
ncbi:MAG TPA: hypothetical protein VJY85_01485 [Candidatus Limnocylindria bacterium]|nr:hypothetical protein [Candidatus Limnocylindria bacterium]